MNEPKLSIVGIYKPRISEETWHDQWEVTENDQETKEHFDHLVLIEAVVEDLTEPFDMCRFGQMNPEFPDDDSRMVVGYDEGLLSTDGTVLLARDIDCVKGEGPLRFAVYLHQYDPERPLLWQSGETACPPVQEIPERLATLMPYAACC